ncbi:MAG: choice-of-anchor A family protein, partial [Oscillospiraceae bacterium]|nr:choice-of-anchor A family protein [Oscillospiraceae bacterium]
NLAGADRNTAEGAVWSPRFVSEADLLLGRGHPLFNDALTGQQLCDVAREEYFMGIASQFCVFLLNDFTVTDSDAEGRVAVGGNITAQTTHPYQIGSGEYAGHGLALRQTDVYSFFHPESKFAHVITNGNIVNIHNESRSWEFPLPNPNRPGLTSKRFLAHEDFFKRFVVSSPTQTFQRTATASPLTLTAANFPGSSGSNLLAQFYRPSSPLINFAGEFTWLASQSQLLAQRQTPGTAVWNGTVLTLTYTGTNTAATTVYFNVPTWNNAVTEIRYVNIPNGAQIIVNNGSTAVEIVGRKVDAANKPHDVVPTFINGVDISNSAGPLVNNNHILSGSVLYNFHSATSVVLGGNFNGTVFAPNGNVTSPENSGKYASLPLEGPGHLSGALIARSYTGGLQFGYIPFQGLNEELIPDPEPEPTTPATSPASSPATVPSTVTSPATTSATTAPTTASVTSPTTAPTTEPTTAPTTEPTTAPTTEPTTASATEPTTASATEPTTASATEPTTVPTTEPTTAPDTEPTTAPITEPTAPPTTAGTPFETSPQPTTVYPTTDPMGNWLGDGDENNGTTSTAPTVINATEASPPSQSAPSELSGTTAAPPPSGTEAPGSTDAAPDDDLTASTLTSSSASLPSSPSASSAAPPQLGDDADNPRTGVTLPVAAVVSLAGIAAVTFRRTRK